MCEKYIYSRHNYNIVYHTMHINIVFAVISVLFLRKSWQISTRGTRGELSLCAFVAASPPSFPRRGGNQLLRGDDFAMQTTETYLCKLAQNDLLLTSSADHKLRRKRRCKITHSDALVILGDFAAKDCALVQLLRRSRARYIAGPELPARQIVWLMTRSFV